MIELFYCVKDKNGVEILKTKDKKEAELYDKALDSASNMLDYCKENGDNKYLKEFMATFKGEDAEDKLMDLFMFMSLNQKDISSILKGKSVSASETDSVSEKQAA